MPINNDSIFAVNGNLSFRYYVFSAAKALRANSKSMHEPTCRRPKFTIPNNLIEQIQIANR